MIYMLFSGESTWNLVMGSGSVMVTASYVKTANCSGNIDKKYRTGNPATIFKAGYAISQG